MLSEHKSYYIKDKSIGYTHLFNGVSFDVNYSADLNRVIKTFNSFSVVGVKECKTGSVPLFVDSGFFGLGYFSYESNIWIDWVILFPIGKRDISTLTQEYSHKILSVIIGYLFNQNSILYVSKITKSFQIIDVKEFLEFNQINLHYYIRRAKHILGSLYNPLLLQECKI